MRALLFLLCLLFVSGCGGSNSFGPLGSPASGPGTVIPLAPTVSKLIGPEGGEVETAGIKLTLPAGALQDEITITMTPVAFGGWSGATAVQLGPPGTSFTVPGELSFPLPPGAPRPRAFTLEDDASHGHRLLVKLQGERVVLPVQHFSFYGFFADINEAWNDSLIFGQNQLAEPQPESALQNLVAFLTPPDPSVPGLLGDHFRTSLLPALDAAVVSEDRLVVFQAMRRYFYFMQVVDFCASAEFPVSVEEFEPIARPKLIALLKRMIHLEGARMVRANNIDHFSKALYWSSVAQQLNLDTPENGLDIPSIIRSLPIELVTRPDVAHGNGPHPDAEHILVFEDEPTTGGGGNGLPPLPGADIPLTYLDQGKEARLELICGYRLGNNTPMSDKPARFHVLLEGGEPGEAEGLETEVSQRTTSGVVDGVLQVIPAPQFTGNSGTAELRHVRLAENSDGINVTVVVNLLGIEKTITRRIEGKLFMAPLNAPSQVGSGGTATIKVPLLRKGNKKLVGKPVQFQIVSGDGQLSADQVLTNEEGEATVELEAPDDGGQVVVEARYTDGDQTVTQRSTLRIDGELGERWNGGSAQLRIERSYASTAFFPVHHSVLLLQLGPSGSTVRLVEGGELSVYDGTFLIWRVQVTGGSFDQSTRSLTLDCVAHPDTQYPEVTYLGGRIEATLSSDGTSLEGTYEERFQNFLGNLVSSMPLHLTRE